MKTKKTANTAESTWLEYASTRSIELRNKIVEENLPLVGKVTHYFAKTLATCVTTDDIYGPAAEGLIDAVEKFDYRRGVSFSSYAFYRMMGSVRDWLRTMDFATRAQRRAAKAENKELTAPKSLSKKVIESDDGNAVELVAQLFDVSQADPAKTVELRDSLEFALSALPPIFQHITCKYFLDQKPMAQIGQEVGLSESRISQMITQAVGQIKPLLESLTAPD